MNSNLNMTSDSHHRGGKPPFLKFDIGSDRDTDQAPRGLTQKNDTKQLPPRNIGSSTLNALNNNRDPISRMPYHNYMIILGGTTEKSVMRERNNILGMSHCEFPLI